MKIKSSGCELYYIYSNAILPRAENFLAKTMLVCCVWSCVNSTVFKFQFDSVQKWMAATKKKHRSKKKCHSMFLWVQHDIGWRWRRVRRGLEQQFRNGSNQVRSTDYLLHLASKPFWHSTVFEVIHLKA